MIPIVSDVYTGVRSVLGDTETAAGQVFTDELLEPHYQTAYSELFRALMLAYSPRIIRRSFYNVPVYTGYINPATMFVENLGDIQSLSERGGVTAWAVSAATPGAAICTVISAATSLASGNQAVLYGVQGITEDINDEWTVTVNSTVSTQLNGCSATGTYTSGGVLSKSTEKFQELDRVQDFAWDDSAPTQRFQKFAWESGIIRVPPCSTVRQLKMYYQISGNAPLTTTASTGIDDCLDFLKYRIAGMVGPSKGMVERSKGYAYLAVGNKWESEQSPGGILAQLLMPGVRNLQGLPPSVRRSPAWRDHRRRAIW